MRVVNSVRQIGSRLAAMSAQLASDISGFAAVEFAMIVPVMIMMLLGCVEVCDALNLQNRVSTIAETASLLVARCSSVSRGDLADVMRISDSIMGKYSEQALKIEIVAVQTDAANTTTVLFSQDRSGGEPYGAGSTYPKLPQGVIAQNHAGIIADVTYAYRSPFGQYIHGTILVHDNLAQVTRDATITLGAQCVY